MGAGDSSISTGSSNVTLPGALFAALQEVEHRSGEELIDADIERVIQLHGEYLGSSSRPTDKQPIGTNDEQNNPAAVRGNIEEATEQGAAQSESEAGENSQGILQGEKGRTRSEQSQQVAPALELEKQTDESINKASIKCRDLEGPGTAAYDAKANTDLKGFTL
ncbi:MAG: hypothetical protein KUG53_01400 [Pseudomonadales bacterium]|nr:hypothetical protein [Pseudomonadales bacterium]